MHTGMLTSAEQDEVDRRKDEVHRARQAITNFCTLMQAAVLRGSLRLPEVYESYAAMQPLLHRNVDSPQVDLTALCYAASRLPPELPTLSRAYVTHRPDSIDGNATAKKLLSEARRRTIYQIEPGAWHIISTDPETSNLDLLCTAAMYGIEHPKITGNIRRHALEQRLSEPTPNTMARLADAFHVSYQDVVHANTALDNQLFPLLQSMMTHDPSSIAFDFDPEFARTDLPIKAELWAKQLKEALAPYGKRPVIVISSDTHGVVNCLTDFALKNLPDIARLSGMDPGALEKDRDLLYHATRAACKADHGFAHTKGKYETRLGIRFLRDMTHSGVHAQIIDTAQLDEGGIDTRIHRATNWSQSPLILNIDYAFGKEGKHIMRALCDAFGQTIDSISITGRAGTVSGKFCDVMLPSYVLPQISDGVYGFPNGNQLETQEDYLRSCGVAVHKGGPMLTVPGTAIQNRLVLLHYMDKYGILGLEMEAAPYLDAIEKSQFRKLLRPDIKMNVGYWASDVPLDPKQTLARPHMEAGTKASYALITAILKNVLNNR